LNTWEYILLFLSVLFGGGLAFYFKKNNKELLQLTLSFSGAYILGISVLHLMPVAFSTGEHTTGLYLLGGFFVQLLLERLSQGVEHGHIHAPHKGKTAFAIQIMIGLCIHAFFEGLPLGGYDALHAAHHHDHGEHHLLFGIVLHKAPAAFALVLLFLVSGIQRNIILICLLVFASMSPLGAGVAEYLSSNEILTIEMQVNIISFVIGSFLHIATTILFEMDSTSHHKIPIQKLIVIAVGLGMAILTI